jgi:hypothetical protein
MIDKVMYLWRGGWLENGRGWWHPPNCLAAWPIDEAYKMAKNDEERGLRMTPEDTIEYHREVGLRVTDDTAIYYGETLDNA